MMQKRSSTFFEIKSYKATSIFLFFLIVISCNKTDKEQTKMNKTGAIVKQIKEKPIIFPDSVIHIYKDSLYHKDSLKIGKGKDIKITTKIYGDCHVCVNSLKKWEEEIIPYIDTSKVALYFYIYIEKLYSFRVGLYDKITLDYPLIIDTADYYLRANGFEAYDERFTTLLLNKKNEVVVVGNPTYNEKIKKMYIDNIKKLLK